MFKTGFSIHQDPIPFLQNIQQNCSGGWHIPYDKKENLTIKTVVDNFHRHWLCLTNQPPQKVTILPFTLKYSSFNVQILKCRHKGLQKVSKGMAISLWWHPIILVQLCIYYFCTSNIVCLKFGVSHNLESASHGSCNVFVVIHILIQFVKTINIVEEPSTSKMCNNNSLLS